jgi:hypothetical protein
LSSTKNSYSRSNDWNFKEILKQKASSNLVYQDKRIGWIGSYELHRNFVECVVNQKANGLRLATVPKSLRAVVWTYLLPGTLENKTH